MLGPLCCLAQVSNDLLYEQLKKDFFASHPGPYQGVQGPSQNLLPDSTYIDTSSSTTLVFLGLEIAYQELKLGIARTLTLPAQLEHADGSLQSEEISYRDTLSTQEFRRMYRQSSLSLKGEDPRRRQAWLNPVLWIGLPIVGVIALFTLRSR
ncbi:MAG: hypothetical protein AAF804_13915 [Bacteroidota bacterium]